MIIRDEAAGDIALIRALTTAAFKAMAHSSGTEAAIIDALRRAGALTFSLVAIDGDEPVGHVAFSPVLLDEQDQGWHGLGPIAVRPDRQGRGIGGALIQEGLKRLRALGAKGCVLLGEPAYYGRFGFKAHPALQLAGVPPAYFLLLPFSPNVPEAMVTYHPAFEASD